MRASSLPLSFGPFRRSWLDVSSRWRGVFAFLLLAAIGCGSTARAQPLSETADYAFVFPEGTFEEVHASTVEETADGTLLAAWFGGESEGEDDVEIWLSRKEPGGSWSDPEAMTDFPSDPCWNPVLFRVGQRIRLYFKVGPSPREWVGAYRESTDGGASWGPIQYLPAGQIGPVRSKPILLSDGAILAGSSVEAGYGSGTPGDAPYRSWAGWVERSTDGGRTWSIHGPLAVPGENYGVIQPSLWETSEGHVRALLRSTDGIGKVVTALSTDGGRTWGPGRPTELPNPNSALDAVKLEDERLVLVYNHAAPADWPEGRHALHVAVSNDDGASWTEPTILEQGDGEFSYPAIIQTRDGDLHVTYTWKRTRIRHVTIAPDELPAGP